MDSESGLVLLFHAIWTADVLPVWCPLKNPTPFNRQRGLQNSENFPSSGVCREAREVYCSADAGTLSALTPDPEFQDLLQGEVLPGADEAGARVPGLFLYLGLGGGGEVRRAQGRRA